MDLPILRYLLISYDIGLRFELLAIVLAICFLVFCLFQKFFPNVLFGEDSEFAGYIYNAMGVVFSLVFAFVTVLVWQNYNGVSDAVAKEASTLNNMYRVFAAFPPEVERNGKAELKSYVTTVINEEWPLLSNDQFSIKAYKELLSIEDLVIHLKPQNAGETNAHQQLLRLTLEATELRRSRVYNARFALSPPAWFGLVSSLMIFFGVLLPFSNEVQTNTHCADYLFELNGGRHFVLPGFVYSPIPWSISHYPRPTNQFT
ncbi:hypothetical protein A9236_07850 [Polynucleobacter sp. QLW-P1DATA-2]|uniref:bestrophin-like domain n=1 Tax=Polynucleobacter sp. QLW-P1DATA-2 TaxID=1743167 RepID=UPI0008F94846|nr:DUF4239 domain-containing protein [Polynucleobacter sp. QLW-P1DATA-2]OIN01075.1 hypothetical protein A9236_07850 [Polynucleobacter sp. QLW-P1DATA-2]